MLHGVIAKRISMHHFGVLPFAASFLLQATCLAFVKQPITTTGRQAWPFSLRRPYNTLVPLCAERQNEKNFETLVLEALFGSLESSARKNAPEDPNKVLAEFPTLVVTNDSTRGSLDYVLVAHESLVRYLRQWAFLLETDQGLATPIVTSTQPLTRQAPHSETMENTTTTQEIKKDYVRITFRPPPRYLSYNEQRDLEKGVLPDRKGGKLDSKSPGGVQLIVLTRIQEEKFYQLDLVAVRCGIDGDTIIKVSSERTIIRRLCDAIKIWKKVRDI